MRDSWGRGTEKKDVHPGCGQSGGPCAPPGSWLGLANRRSESPQTNSSQRAGVGEWCPAMAQCGHLQRQHWREAGGKQKGPSGTKAETRTGKERHNCMSPRGDQREEVTEGALLSFWAGKGPRAQLYPLKRCLGWQEQLAQLGPRSPLQERVFHFQIRQPSVLSSRGAQRYGPLDAAGIKACVQKMNVFY